MKSVSRRDVFHALGGVVSAPILLSRADAEVSPEIVRFRPEIEPLVQLIERTPREKCAEMAVEQLRRGVSYRQFLAALFLAGIRNVNPRPPGFAMHCVFVIHSAHLLGMEAPSDIRLFPLFYALDHFKVAQERDARGTSGDYTMRALTPERSASNFAAAMDSWNAEQAERAMVSLAQHQSASEVMDLLWPYGARDYRNIGHKAIYVANAERTLHAIGWQHAEPVLRSIALSLVDFGAEQQVNGYAFADQCYNANRRRVTEIFGKLDSSWTSEKTDPAATRAILTSIREATPDQACASLAERMVKEKTTAGTVWDAVHLAAAELMMRGAGIVAIHGVTSANALHYAYIAAPDPKVRVLILLQAVGWMGQFRSWAEKRQENLRAFSITTMEPSADSSPVDRQLSEIFTGISSSNVDAAAARAFRMAQDPSARLIFLSAALRSTITKADEVHHYKYLAALIEDIPLVSAEWQPHLTAASVYYLKGAKDSESAPIKRAREVLGRAS